mgnify:CR=1 FL=1
MEFYENLQNSITKFIEEVSIPNGMEFYGFFSGFVYSYFISFNSQRDGILQTFDFRVVTAMIVSIPNGMEFYVTLALSAGIQKEFQFPTGWNSTNYGESP